MVMHLQTFLGEDTCSSAAEHYQIRNTSSVLDRNTLRYGQVLCLVLCLGLRELAEK